MFRDSQKVPFREFSTPPPSRRTPWRSSPSTPLSEKKKPSPQSRSPSKPSDFFHVLHKVPTGDSPYVKAKHVQLIEKDPGKAISLFWSAINAGDRVDSALKDMAIVMKQLNRTDEAIEAIKSFRRLCSHQAQESLDNVLIDLYKRGGRLEEHIELLQHKLKLIEEGVAFNGKRTKISRSQGKKFHISVEQERSRLLGNLAWAYMQRNNYKTAEELYRRALSIEPDNNKQCNLAICLMNLGRITEARSLLEDVRPSATEQETVDSYIKSFDRALETLSEFEEKSVQKLQDNVSSTYNGDGSQAFGFSTGRKWSDNRNDVPKESCNSSAVKHGTGSYSQCQSECIADSPGFNKNGQRGVEQTSSSHFPHHLPNIDKWDRAGGSCPQNKLEESSCSKNENLVGESRKGGGVSSMNRRSSKLISTVPHCKSGSSSQDWRRAGSQGDKKEQCINSPLRMESPMTVDTLGAMDSQKLGGCLQHFGSQGSDQRSNVKVSASVSEDIVVTANEESHSVTYDSNTVRNSTKNKGSSYFKSGKSWADMAEEEEDLFEDCKDDFFSRWEYLSQEPPSTSFQTPQKWVHRWHDVEDTFQDENMDSNIIDPSPHPPGSSARLSSLPQKDLTEKLTQEFKLVDLKDGERCNKSTDKSRLTSSATRRALSFDQQEHNGLSAPTGTYRPPPLRNKAFDIIDFSCEPLVKGSGSKGSDPIRRWNRRLPVFQDITLQHSPRA